ncbi:MAG TPA: amidohydrolase family protein [Allosphingosinicella sp.]|jgi:imidazolonepropionase-like amidohydrolase
MKAATFLSALLLLAGCGRPAAAAPALLIEHVTLIDGRGGPPRPDAAVLVEGERIAAVGRDVLPNVPADARRIDGRGKFLLPGLIDSHVHLKTRVRDPGMIEQILANVLLKSGVTTVRDMGGNGEGVRPLAEASRRPGARSPEIVYAALFTGAQSDFWLNGDLVRVITPEGEPGSRPWFRHFPTSDGLEQAVRDAKAFGASGVKLHSGLTAAEVARIGAEARRQGLRLWTHAFIGPARPSDAVEAGAATISHVDMLAYESAAEPMPPLAGPAYVQRTRRLMEATPVDGPVLRRLFTRMREKGTCLEPTLLVMTRPTPEMARYDAWAAAATDRAHRAGVAICAGTDGIGGSTSNLPEELKLLVERAQLTPLEAIRAATFENARALGLADRGLVAPGKRADLLLLSADPTADIANVKKVAGVVARGIWHEVH